MYSGTNQVQSGIAPPCDDLKKVLTGLIEMSDDVNALDREAKD